MGIGSTPKGPHIPQQDKQFLMKVRQTAESAAAQAAQALALAQKNSAAARKAPAPVTTAPSSPTAARLVQSAIYGADLVEGQVVYLDAGTAYPVNNTMTEAVSHLLAIVLTGSSTGFTADVMLTGPAKFDAYSLIAGRILLGGDSFPTNTYDPEANWIPLGHSDGGDDFFFNPPQRFLLGES